MKINRDKFALEQSVLRAWIYYDPITGEFYRTKKIIPKSGRVVECWKKVTGTNNRGYVWVNLFGDMYLAHRLAFLYVLGRHPENEVDHINGDRLDNRWDNLRECSPFENSRNQGIRKDNTSGVRGVTFWKNTRGKKPWVARISHQGERILIGNFETFEEAVAARKNAEREYGYHKNHGGRESWRE